MQKHQIYEIFDSKANCYETPFFSQNHDTAMRDFHRVINNGASKYNAYPEDFALFHAGEWDQDEAEWDLHGAPIHVINAVKLYEAWDEPDIDPQAHLVPLIPKKEAK